ncbi:membrane protein [Anopheles sinensis]|uniref:Membrane protein n=1 Tax=Anopheles sinensis TaxID=74873 RepID=A0A084VCM9_ANOSI|nr:membrane protein [Anopheles sinensis]
MSKRVPSKLCRRTYFLQTGTAPSISEMRKELGPELADVIIETLQPSQRTAVQPERLLVSCEPTPVEGHDSERMRGQIHERILLLGDKISQRVHGYWRERLRTAATTAGTSSDDVDFCRFECRQKIDIAREQERQRYEELLRDMEKTMRQRFLEEKGELHRSYAKARALWAEFVCRKVRKQAKEMLHKIATHYRVQLEQEVTRRMQQEKSRIVSEMEQIVKTAVEQQKRMDERAIHWMINQYEELLKFVNEYNSCLQVVEMTREVCALHSTPHECRSTQVSLDVIEDIGENSSENLVLDDHVTLPPDDLSKWNVFVVSQCLPGCEIESVSEEVVPIEYPSKVPTEPNAVENQRGALDEESERSSVEKITIGGLTYAQPKFGIRQHE